MNQRVIKFRVWVKDKMQFSNEIGSEYFHNWHEVLSKGIFPEQPILMQYTGLLDKNGKEIYEGDIVKRCEPFPKRIGSIVWNEKSAGWATNWLSNGEYTMSGYCGIDPFECTNLEVIGSIYENPELLK